MNKIVSLELAKLLKKSGYHDLCSNCYVWEYGDPIEDLIKSSFYEKSGKDLL